MLPYLFVCMYVQSGFLPLTLSIYIYSKPGKKLASWQLDAIVEGLETTQRGKNDVKLQKSDQNQRGKMPKRHV